MSRDTKVGEWTVREPEVWRITYETASWYTDVEVQPGTYDAVVYPTYDGIGHSIYLRAHGVCVGSYFVNRLLTASSAHKDEDVGKEYDVHKTIPPYDVGAHLESERLKITNPEFTTEEWSYTSDPEGINGPPTIRTLVALRRVTTAKEE